MAIKTTEHDIDEQSLRLSEEFKQHFEEFITEYPNRQDRGLIFEGWVIQKIASLQLLLTELYEMRLDDVDDDISDINLN